MRRAFLITGNCSACFQRKVGVDFSLFDFLNILSF
jgi:hypothetical protein